VYSDGATYEGGWFEGDMHGQGLLVYNNSNTLTGEFKDGLIYNGEGTCKLQSGGIYEGVYKEGKIHGQGVYKDKKGFVYNGDCIEYWWCIAK